MNKIIPVAQAMNITDAKGAVNKEWVKLEKLPAWQVSNVKSKKRSFWITKRESKSSMDNSGTFAVLTEKGSSPSQMTAAKVMDVIAR